MIQSSTMAAMNSCLLMLMLMNGVSNAFTVPAFSNHGNTARSIIQTSSFQNRPCLFMSSTPFDSSSDECDVPEEDETTTTTAATDLSFTPPNNEEVLATSTETTRYAEGDELLMLRVEITNLQAELAELRQSSHIEDEDRMLELENEIINAQNRDAEFLYKMYLNLMDRARIEGNTKEVREFEIKAKEARNALPQFNLDGLWIGKYNNDYQIINVTYDGDMLYAEKVTGGGNVPKGEVTFKVNLDPTSRDQQVKLRPIELSEASAAKWGCKYLPRHRGMGLVAEENFNNPQWIEGHLVMVNEYISFAWVPIGHQIFFGRPSEAMVKKLLKKSQEATIEIDELRARLQKSLDATDRLEAAWQQNFVTEQS